MGTWTDSAAQAARRHPACLAGFALSVVAPDGAEISNCVAFRLGCKSCGRDVFRISSFPIVVPDPSPYAAMAPGAVLHRPPHDLACTACGARSGVFDAKSQGYDGALNGGCSYESGSGAAAFVTGAFTVVVTLTYNIALSELEEIGAEEEVEPADLFDGFQLQGLSSDGGQPFEIVYECA